ncbi:MAG TPA: VOC family protein [Kineosporiaceae bacterium]|nr:VOC family protein [Kineosporiaceae bacterium]
MATRLDCVVIDTPDPAGLARWWARALGWTPMLVEDADWPEDVSVVPPDGKPGIELVFVPVTDPKQAKNRIHLDLAARTAQEQADIVERLERLGARRVDIGQGEVPWTVLADPEGNELCVLDPRDRYRQTGSVGAVVVDAIEPVSLSRFWAAATGWTITDSGPNGAALHPTAEPGGSADAVGPYLEFVPSDEPHRVKNRWHLDVRPLPGADQAAEVERLLDLGARRAEVGQAGAPPEQVTWTVLADPEGNEFCVLCTIG